MTKRLFLAINLPENIKIKILNQIGALKKKHPNLNWVKAEGLHITLYFLGDCDESTTALVENLLDKGRGKFNKFIFTLGQINAFPNLKMPRVLYLACEQTNGRGVFGLYRFLETGLVNLGFEIDRRPWTPHITLARIKNRIYLASDMKINYTESFSVDSFELMESQLDSRGAEYKIVKSIKL